MSIGERIAEYRKRAALSQEQLAEKLGVSRQSVSKWESGGVMPDLDKIIAMSDLFGVSTDALLKGGAEESGSSIPDAAPSDGSGEAGDILTGISADSLLRYGSEEEAGGLPDPSPDPEPENNEGGSGPKKPEEVFIGTPEDEEDEPEVDDDLVSPEAPSRDDGSEKKKNLKGVIGGVIAVLLVFAIIVGMIAIPMRYGSFKNAWKALFGGEDEGGVKYTYVLVSGMGGWGDGVGINTKLPYWGAGTGSLAEYLTSEGYTVVEATVGPFSSAWDRACELYAQLTGTTVDYGKAHSEEHGHARFGRAYPSARVPGWGARYGGHRVKIHLIGHSFGGATVRLLASLLAYGDPDERKATSKSDTSPLFTGGKADWVQSVTALCAPHNGSSLTEVLNTTGKIVGLGSATDLMASLLFSFAGMAKPLDETYDFMLDQFGVTRPMGLIEAYNTVNSSGRDNVSYDLSPDGAAKLNEKIKLSDEIYYFSYPYSTTQKGSLLGVEVPIKQTLPVLMPTALAIGNYSGTTDGGIVIDKAWHENDGLVSVISALHPTNDPYAELPEDTSALETGVWYVAPVRTGDHGTVIGMQATVRDTHLFYDELFTMLLGLSR